MYREKGYKGRVWRAYPIVFDMRPKERILNYIFTVSLDNPQDGFYPVWVYSHAILDLCIVLKGTVGRLSHPGSTKTQ